jgi:hypothetical protein
MSTACNVHRGDEKCIQNFSRKGYLKDIGVDVRIILKWMLRKYDVRVSSEVI